MSTVMKPEQIDTPETVQPIEPPPAKRRRSGKAVALPIVILLAIVGLFWIGKTWLYNRAHESTDNAQVDGHIVPVLAKVGGYVSAVSIAENDRVTEGGVLVQIDSSELHAKLAQAEGDLAAAEAAVGGNGGIGQADAAVLTASSQRASLDAQVTAARANEARALSDLQRATELADKQIVSRQQLDAARAAAEAASAQRDATERQAAAGSSSVTSAQAGVRLAHARIAAAQAARDNAALQVAFTHITAPVAGVVSRKNVEVGQLVQPGQPLLSIVSDSGVWVTANLKETQLSDVRVGQPVELEVDAYDGCVAQGKVESIGAATGAKFALLPPDNATGNFTKVVQRVPVRVAIERGCGEGRSLRPGMSVVAHVTTR
jgi:membrane fusion protein (multidrug efflux system)